MRALALALLACVVGGHAAAQTVVTRCARDVDPGPGTDFATAMQAGGRIRFACPGGTRIVVTREHFVNGTTEIDGEGKVTLDAQGSTNMFRADWGGSTFTLRNIALQNGRSMPGRPAMIWGVMDTVLDNVEIVASERPIAIESRKIVARGTRFLGNTGPVIEAPNLDLRDSYFSGTIGAVMRGSGGTATLDGVRVTGTRDPAKDESSRFSDCTLDIRNSVFSDITIPNGPGGSPLMVDCRSVHIRDTRFENNRAAFGGALHIGVQTSAVELRAVTFTGNVAWGDGGAIAVDSGPSERRLTVLRSIFRVNRAARGGAISLGLSRVPSGVRLDGGAVSFKANAAIQRGGAIDGEGAAGVALARVILVDNAAPDGAALALAGTPAPVLHLANCIVARSAGGGAALSGALDGYMVNCTVAGNGGTGLRTMAGRLRLVNSVVAGNGGGGCELIGGAVEDGGANRQFPDGSCGAGVAVADPQLDDFFVPALSSPLQRAGDPSACAEAPVDRKDVFGQRRPRAPTGACTIGAVEGDIETLVRRVKRSDRSDAPP
jgi:predicted outer membrane repeat protein